MQITGPPLAETCRPPSLRRQQRGVSFWHLGFLPPSSRCAFALCRARPWKSRGGLGKALVELRGAPGESLEKSCWRQARNTPHTHLAFRLLRREERLGRRAQVRPPRFNLPARGPRHSAWCASRGALSSPFPWLSVDLLTLPGEFHDGERVSPGFGIQYLRSLPAETSGSSADGTLRGAVLGACGSLVRTLVCANPTVSRLHCRTCEPAALAGCLDREDELHSLQRWLFHACKPALDAALLKW